MVFSVSDSFWSLLLSTRLEVVPRGRALPVWTNISFECNFNRIKWNLLQFLVETESLCHNNNQLICVYTYSYNRRNKCSEVIVIIGTVSNSGIPINIKNRSVYFTARSVHFSVWLKSGIEVFPSKAQKKAENTKMLKLKCSLMDAQLQQWLRPRMSKMPGQKPYKCRWVLLWGRGSVSIRFYKNLEINTWNRVNFVRFVGGAGTVDPVISSLANELMSIIILFSEFIFKKSYLDYLGKYSRQIYSKEAFS